MNSKILLMFHYDKHTLLLFLKFKISNNINWYTDDDVIIRVYIYFILSIQKSYTYQKLPNVLKF